MFFKRHALLPNILDSSHRPRGMNGRSVPGL